MPIKVFSTIQHNGSVAPMERASGAWMATVKPHGWVHAALGMGGAGPSTNKVNSYKYFLIMTKNQREENPFFYPRRYGTGTEKDKRLESIIAKDLPEKLIMQ
jgi:hypothetical protein